MAGKDPRKWQDRKEYYRIRYHRMRAKLVAEMGGKCVDCGTTEKLEFNHKHERKWVASKLNRRQRIVRYQREWKQKLIELLCGTCNKKRGKPTGVCGFCGEKVEPGEVCPCGD